MKTKLTFRFIISFEWYELYKGCQYKHRRIMKMRSRRRKVHITSAGYIQRERSLMFTCSESSPYLPIHPWDELNCWVGERETLISDWEQTVIVLQWAWTLVMMGQHRSLQGRQRMRVDKHFPGNQSYRLQTLWFALSRFS